MKGGSWRAAALVPVVVACSLLPLGQDDDGAEQFTFVVVAGPGRAPEAEGRLADSFGGRGAVTDVDHVASAGTPIGRIDLYEWTERGLRCFGIAAPAGSAASCDNVDPPQEVRLGGWDDQDWVVVDVRTGDEVEEIQATAEDGTEYRANAVRGRSLIVYPVKRGLIEVAGFDRDGDRVGNRAFFGPSGE